MLIHQRLGYWSCIYTIFNAVILREQCSGVCSTLHGYHSVDRSCHMLKVYNHIKQEPWPVTASVLQRWYCHNRCPSFRIHCVDYSVFMPSSPLYACRPFARLPSSRPLGSSSTANKFAVVVRLLLGEIPNRATFQEPFARRLSFHTSS